MARRPDPVRVLQAQIAGTRQRLADLDLLIPRGQANEQQRVDTLEHFEQLEAKLAALQNE